VRKAIPTGLLYMAYGAFWFSAMSLFVKLAGQRLPSMQIVLVRAVITLLLSYALLRRARLPAFGKGPHGLLLLRGVFGFIALTFFYFSIINLPLAEATVIQYMNPLFVAVLAAVLLGERMGVREVAGVGVSLAGVLIIARPEFLFGEGGGLDPRYVTIALMGAVFSALAYVTVRQLRATHNALVVVFYFPLVAVPLSLPFAIPGWIWPTPAEWALLAAIGVTTQAGQVYITRGLQLEAAGRATAIGYLQIVFAAIWSMLVFRERPDIWSVLGAAMIIGSTLYVSLNAASASPPPARHSTRM
jgi:drug/metabolite transporter (DMT)-like permease